MIVPSFPSVQARSWRRACRRGSWVLVVLGCLALAGCMRRVPEIQGQVLDGRTGEPVAGAFVGVVCFRAGKLDLVDGHAPRPVMESKQESQTGNDGRFTLPGQWFSSLDRIEWVVFEPGLMPARWWYRKPGWGTHTPGSHSLFGPGNDDPWVKATDHAAGGRLELAIRLLPPTTEGIEPPFGESWNEYDPATGKREMRHFPEDIDPWGEYFRRLNLLTRDGWLPRDTFVDEAVGYVERGGQVSENMTWPVYELLSRLGSERVCSEAGLRGVLRGLLNYCRAHPQSPFCSRRAAPVTCQQGLGDGEE